MPLLTCFALCIPQRELATHPSKSYHLCVEAQKVQGVHDHDVD